MAEYEIQFIGSEGFIRPYQVVKDGHCIDRFQTREQAEALIVEEREHDIATAEKCLGGCGFLLVRRNNIRTEHCPKGYRPHRGLGLCNRCHSVEWRRAHRPAGVRPRVKRAEVVAAWESHGRSIAPVMEALSMSRESVTTALRRAGYGVRQHAG